MPSHRLSGWPMPFRSTISTGKLSMYWPVASVITMFRSVMVIPFFIPYGFYETF